jgi:hypothetical protein
VEEIHLVLIHHARIARGSENQDGAALVRHRIEVAHGDQLVDPLDRVPIYYLRFGE